MIFKKLSNKEISILSKFIVLHAFRNGHIEEIHCEGRLSDEDMKKIVKSSVTELATVLDGLINERGPYTWPSRWNFHEIKEGWDEPDWNYVNKINNHERKEPNIYSSS